MSSLSDTQLAPPDSMPGGRGPWGQRYVTKPRAVAAAAHTDRRHMVLGIAVGAIIAIGFLIRLFASIQLSSHIDESSSILAAHAAAVRGWPILPSGTVYFQGATLSYLLQPFVWLGIAELEYLIVMRLVLVVAGTVAIYLSYRLGCYLTGDARIGTLAAFLVALDPISVQWSAHVRMYALLQACTIGLAWAFIHLLNRGASWRRCLVVVALCWAAVFTHVGASILVLAMAVATILYGGSIFKQWKMVGTLMLCGLAPVTLIGLNRLLGTASASAEGGASAPTLTFVGASLLQPFARLGVLPNNWDWQMLIHPITLIWLLPGVVVACSTVIGGSLLWRRNRFETRINTRRAVITLLSFYWVTVAVVALCTVSLEERYLLHVHSLGYLFVAVILVHLMERYTGGLAGVRSAAAKLTLVIVVMGMGSGIAWRLDERVVQPDYISAMEYVEAHHLPGQPIVVAWPPVSYLAMGDSGQEDLYFLTGSPSRAERYTLSTNDESHIDYWIGVDSIDTIDGLRLFLEENPDAWVVVDQDRLESTFSYAGEIDRLLEEMTFTVFQAPGAALVLRPESPDEIARTG
ncbi:MAG TPA: glycosyltransferase family 39 protein [Thermomicrobiales bacterium]|nr:glycosyltransferase family 39 protein [Thermomicrobiales bacterium]